MDSKNNQEPPERHNMTEVKLAMTEIRRVVGHTGGSAMDIRLLAARANLRYPLAEEAVMHLYFLGELRRRWDDGGTGYLCVASRTMLKPLPPVFVPERLKMFRMPCEERWRIK